MPVSCRAWHAAVLGYLTCDDNSVTACSPTSLRMDYDDVLRTRQTLEGRNVTLSYKQPLHIVRAEGCRMYESESNTAKDSQEKPFLDCVNNVAHVGHSAAEVQAHAQSSLDTITSYTTWCQLSTAQCCCKRHTRCRERVQVVKAQKRQLDLVNTNSRYLAEVHTQYLVALTSKFPDPLKRIYLVNSGSEANDLALQIAMAARPGAAHIACMGGAYHGHVSSMMHISPYKFWGPRGAGGPPQHVHVLPLPDMYRCVPTQYLQVHCCQKMVHVACALSPLRPLSSTGAEAVLE